MHMRLQSIWLTWSSIALLFQSTTAQSESPLTLPLSEDETFNFDLLYPLGQAIYSGADISPILRIAAHLDPGNFTDWQLAFHALANETKAQAEDPKLAYDPINVRETWFSAAQYFRRADNYLHDDWADPLINLLWEEQTYAFNKAMAALPIPGERVRVPADNFTVEAIWYKSTKEQAAHRPTLILGPGYDGAQEDLYHTIVVPALARGWNCLTYEGPGQPTVRRYQGLGFIPDWERVVTPLVDYLLSNRTDEIDESRVVLLGQSFGGYLAARAAAFEPRLAAVILNGGIYDTHESFVNALSPELREMYDSSNKSAFDQSVFTILETPSAPSELRWGIAQGLWTFKALSPFEFFQKVGLYTIKDVADRIKMPVFIANAEAEGFFPGQPQKVADALGERATLHNFTGAAAYHCQGGAYTEFARVLFAWLNETLG